MYSSQLSRRIAFVIDQYDDGNVSAAARRIGVSQRGLQKLYRGVTANPRSDLIAKVAIAYSLDPAWLVTGAAPPTLMLHLKGAWR